MFLTGVFPFFTLTVLIIHLHPMHASVNGDYLYYVFYDWLIAARFLVRRGNVGKLQCFFFGQTKQHWVRMNNSKLSTLSDTDSILRWNVSWILGIKRVPITRLHHRSVLLVGALQFAEKYRLSDLNPVKFSIKVQFVWWLPLRADVARFKKKSNWNLMTAFWCVPATF